MFKRVELQHGLIAWECEGTPLAILAGPREVVVTGGQPVFDTNTEKIAWAKCCERALIAQQYMRQRTAVPSDDTLEVMRASAAAVDTEAM